MSESPIKTPSGGGAQSGLGEKFNPDLFTGTGNFSVPIALPSGRNGFQPEVGLSYSTGGGNGVFGLGWNMGIPGVMRKTDTGIPKYDNKNDVFVLSGAEDLIEVERSDNWIRYRPRTEGLFAKIYRYLDTENDYWKVLSKDGLVSWYGTEGTKGQDQAVIADPRNREKIFAWKLTKTQDPFGNIILYEYERDETNTDQYHEWDQVYLKAIKYVDYEHDGETKFLVSVGFEYENRPDAFSSCKSGFEIRTVRRCSNIKVYTHPVEGIIHTRTYKFWYADNFPGPGSVYQPHNGASLLCRVEVTGHDGELSEKLPPLDFRYSHYNPGKQKFKKMEGKGLPLESLATPGYELIDLFGNGLPDIVEVNGVVRYWRNLGDGNFDVAKLMKEAPAGISLQDPNVQLIDANGDGRADLLVNAPGISGYYSTTFNASWDQKSFKKYEKAPSFALSDPEVRMIDLDGDGITDAIRSGSSFECFYNHKDEGWHKVSTVKRKRIEGFPNISFNDPRVKWADMSGDGLQDIVLVRNGNIIYWPNYGYGNFGKPVTMKKSPRFGQDFDPQRLLLGDVDGDGQADLVYIDTNKVHFCINNSGNGWGEKQVISGTPTVVDMAGVRLADVMGSGVSGVLYSFDAITVPSRPRWYFLDLTGGIKPYLLHEMDNNMGALTRVNYLPSTRHYLADQFGKSPFDIEGEGDYNKRKPWKTTLPFPVQVVSQVEVIDKISKGKLTTQYLYHHGYWDGGEREFRGFGRVDQRDTETFERYNGEGLQEGEEFNQVEFEHYTPPTETRNWFHLGPIGDEFGAWEEVNFEDEYWQEDLTALDRPLEIKDLLKSLPRRAKRDALRTMRGTSLRTELYALDTQENGVYVPGANGRPYTVTESLPGVRLEYTPPAEQAQYFLFSNRAGSGYIFFPLSLGSRKTQWERGHDPMTQLSFMAEYDAYGQPLKQLSIAVPRARNYRVNTLSAEAELDTPFEGWQGDPYLSTVSWTTYAQKDEEDGLYMVNRVCRALSYEVINDGSESAYELKDRVLGADLPVTGDTVNYKIIGCSLSYYDGAAFTGLPYGQLGDYGVPVKSETLVITDAIINEAYGSNTPECFKATPDWSGSNDYPATFENYLQNDDDRLGYLPKTFANDGCTTGYYTVSGQTKYDFQDNPLTAKGLILETKDVFENYARVEYDQYDLLPLKAHQVLDNISDYKLTTEAEYDYRVFQTSKITDVNGNRSEFTFTPLGLLYKSAVMGKVTESLGDTLDHPTVLLEYDFFAFYDEQEPVWVKTTQRINHWQDGINDDTITAIEYTDGFGRLLQTRSLAEDVIFGDQIFGSSGLPADQSDPNAAAVGVERNPNSLYNVRVSGWQVYNNKGKVVEQYEPFFSKGFDYNAPVESQMGHKVRMYYDPAGAPFKTESPNGSLSLAVLGVPNLLSAPPLDNYSLNKYKPTPWESYAYDANDLALLTHPTGSGVPTSHHWTPSNEFTDAYKRVIRKIERLGNTEIVETTYQYDIKGNLLKVIDALNRSVFSNIYDLASQNISSLNIDNGRKTIVSDYQGKPILLSNQRGGEILSCYDTLNRPIQAWAKDEAGDSYTVRGVTIYGDNLDKSGLTESDAKNKNLLAVPFKSYSEGGVSINDEIDFKGNVLKRSQKVILDSLLQSETAYIIDWPEIEDANFDTLSDALLDHKAYDSDADTDGYILESTYDALNRAKKITLPKDVNDNRKDITPQYNRSGSLESVEFDGTIYVEYIGYNAKGDRLLAAFGNEIMTRYTYDTETFILKRQRSETYSQTGFTFTSGGSVKQDTVYSHDLNGNLIQTKENRTNSGFGLTLSGAGGATPDELIREFEYDPMYRLLKATGREGTSQSENNLWSDVPSQPPTPGNTREYKRRYEYDKVGNITKLSHQAYTNSFTRNFIYSDITQNNSLTRVENGGSSLLVDFDYDSNGNTIQANTDRYYEWNHSNKLKFFKIDDGMTVSVYGQYRYAGGNRVKKLVKDQNGNYTTTVYVGGFFEYQKLVKMSGTYERNYTHIVDDKSRIASVRTGSNEDDISDSEYYVIEDTLNSVTARLASNGSVIDREEQYPFGETSLRNFAAKRYRYTGKEKDSESGLYYYGARYYSAWCCRFISVDPLAWKFAQLSSYNYASNNPITYKDIDGMQRTDQEASKQGDGGNNQNVIYKTAEPLPTIVVTAKKPETSSDVAKSFMSGFVKGALIGLAIGAGAVLVGAAITAVAGPIIGAMVGRMAFMVGLALMMPEIDTVVSGKDAYTGEVLTASERAERAGELVGGIAGGIAGGRAVKGVATRIVKSGVGKPKATTEPAPPEKVAETPKLEKPVEQPEPLKPAEQSKSGTQQKATGENPLVEVAFDRNKVGKTINNFAKQNEHVKDTPQYKLQIKDNGRYKSYLTKDPNRLLGEFHEGKGTVVGENPAHRSVVVKFDEPIGNVLDESTGELILEGTYYGAIKYGKNVHIVPVPWSTN